MLTRVQAQQINGEWKLRTIWGNPVSFRMIAGDEAPAIETSYPTEGAARKAALIWNEYLLKMRKKKSSTAKTRKSDGSDYVQDYRD